MSVSLSIDTSDRMCTSVTVQKGDETWQKSITTTNFSSQVVLPLIEDILSEHGLHVSDITDVHVAVGPGSFTGLRVGASVGQMISFLLSIPINEKSAGNSVPLVYT